MIFFLSFLSVALLMTEILPLLIQRREIIKIKKLLETKFKNKILSATLSLFTVMCSYEDFTYGMLGKLVPIYSLYDEMNKVFSGCPIRRHTTAV